MRPRPPSLIDRRNLLPALLVGLLLLELLLGLAWVELGGVGMGIFEIRNAREIAGHIPGDLPGLIQRWNAHHYYPPGYDSALALVYAVVQNDASGLLIFNWLLLCLGCWGMVDLLGRREGAIAAMLFSLLPGVSLGLHLAAREYALTCLMPCLLAALYHSDGLLRLRRTLLAALWFCLAMYAKWTFAAQALIPGMAFLIAGSSVRPLRLRTRLVNLCVGGALCLALLSAWYLRGLDTQALLFASANDPSDLSLWQTLSYYLRSLVNDQLLWPAALLGLAALPLALYSRRRMALPALLWLIGPIVVFTPLAHCEARYIQPVVGAVALLAALALTALPSRRVLQPLTIAALVLLGLYGVTLDKFQRPMLLRDSGTRVQVNGLSCFGLAREYVDWLDQTLPRYGVEGAPARAMLHPLSANDVLLGPEIVGYELLRQRRRASGPWSVELMTHERLGEFICDLGSYDLLLIPDQLAQATLDTQRSMARGWLSEQDPALEELIDWSDPALLGSIERQMRPVARFTSYCAAGGNRGSGITLYQRKIPGEPPAPQCALGLLSESPTLY
ncbi:MAG: hypothetical protein P9M14_12510 [Candidatus Alcyoniella australis]|nr:hypothetical protein [Candidatus Alcyoniella australis]